MKKRILSSILTFLMIFTILPNFTSAEINKDYTIEVETYNDLWLQETIDYETRMGKMIDEISGTKGEYLKLALSTNGNDREKFVNHVISSNRVISGYGIGDVIQTLRKSVFNYYPEHTMILTRISGSDFKYSAHSIDRADANLTTALGDPDYATYKIKFYAMY